MKQSLLGHPPKGLGRPDLHHADQMPGPAIHEILPAEHRGNKALAQNKDNQVVTPQMRDQDKNCTGGIVRQSKAQTKHFQAGSTSTER